MSARYMIVSYIKRPHGNWDELTQFKNSLRPNDIQTAKVILDFKKETCVVNSINKEASYNDMLEFYKRLLGDQLIPYLPQESL